MIYLHLDEDILSQLKYFWFLFVYFSYST